MLRCVVMQAADMASIILDYIHAIMAQQQKPAKVSRTSCRWLGAVPLSTRQGNVQASESGHRGFNKADV